MNQKQFERAEKAWEKACNDLPCSDDGNTLINADGQLVIGSETYAEDHMLEIYAVLREWYGDRK